MTMQETEKSIQQDIKELKDSLLRTEFLIRCGKASHGIPEAERRDEDLVKNCQTKTWVHLFRSDDRDILHVQADSLSLLVKGALSLICEIYDNRPFSEAAEYKCMLMDDPDFAGLFSLDEQKGLGGIIQKLSLFSTEAVVQR